MPVYRIHGIRFSSPVPLQAPEVDGVADVRLLPPRTAAVPSETPAGRVVASLDDPRFTLVKDEQGYRYHLPSLAQFTVDEELSVVGSTIDPTQPPGLFAVLASGSLPATIATLRGACVLHASVVLFEGRTIAFAGGSGAGKSTLAAACMREGGIVLADDAAYLERVSGGVWCRSGSDRVRLREGAAALAGSFDDRRVARSPDGRVTIGNVGPTPEGALLDAVCIPVPSRTEVTVTGERLAPADGVLELLRFPRLPGADLPDARRERFRTLAEVARCVPVVRARIPWGPPFDDDLAARIASVLRA